MTPAEPTYFYPSFLYYPFFSLYFVPPLFPCLLSLFFLLFFHIFFSSSIFLSFFPSFFGFPYISLLFSSPFFFFLSSFFYSPGFFLFSPHPFHLISRAPDSQERVWYFTVEQFVPVPQDNIGGVDWSAVKITLSHSQFYDYYISRIKLCTSIIS